MCVRDSTRMLYPPVCGIYFASMSVLRVCIKAAVQIELMANELAYFSRFREPTAGLPNVTADCQRTASCDSRAAQAICTRHFWDSSHRFQTKYGRSPARWESRKTGRCLSASLGPVWEPMSVRDHPTIGRDLPKGWTKTATCNDWINLFHRSENYL